MAFSKKPYVHKLVYKVTSIQTLITAACGADLGIYVARGNGEKKDITCKKCQSVTVT